MSQKLRKISIATGAGNFTATYPAEIVPGWFQKCLSETVRAYAASASKSPIITEGVSNNLFKLVHEYFIANRFPTPRQLPAQPSKNTFTFPVFDKDRVSVMFTAGKDSLHLLVRLIERGIRPGNIQAVYVKNLNRSETWYEQRAIPEIASLLGITYQIVDVTNSIRLNRTGHNIGLREQLILACALPYILDFKSPLIFYGLHDGFEHMSPPLYTSHKSAFDIYRNYLFEDFNVRLFVANHPDYPNVSEHSIAKDLITRHRDLLNKSRSCYTQKNFREHHHGNLQAKIPNIPIYNGCGYCLKCLRINGAILLYCEQAGKAPEPEKSFLRKHLKYSADEKFPHDKTLKDIVSLL